MRAKAVMMDRVRGVSDLLQAHASHFVADVAYGDRLIRVLVRGGWAPTYFARAREHALKQGVVLTPLDADGWVVRARPPRSIANSFDIPVEVLFFCTTYRDLQARTVDTARLLGSAESRSSREVVFLVTQDPDPDSKLAHLPNTYGVIPLSLDWIQEADGGFLGENPLRDRIGRFLYAQDLFDQRTPVIDDRFFGRQPDLDRLRLAVLKSEHLGLLGLRKIGKTSLLRMFGRSANLGGREREALLLANIDLQSLPPGEKSTGYLLWRIGSELLQSWRVRSGKGRGVGTFRLFGLQEPPSNVASIGSAFMRDFRKLLASAESAGFEPFVGVVLDEIEVLLPPRESSDDAQVGVEVLRFLRGLTQEGLPVSVIVAGANAYFAEYARFGDADNPLLNFVTKYYLAPLTERETRTMVSSLGSRMGLRFAHDALGLVYAETGGHPFVTRQLCSAVNASIPRGRPRDVRIKDVRVVLEHFVEDHSETFEQVFDALRFYPDERFLLDQLARDEGSAAEWLEGESTRVRHLVGYGLISVADGRPRLTVPLFGAYLSGASK